nr:tumor necrosis factor receptor superfamily member 16-like isoform X1 [Pocillopora verrucosa]
MHCLAGKLRFFCTVVKKPKMGFGSFEYLWCVVLLSQGMPFSRFHSVQTIAVGCGPGTFLNSTALVCQKCPNGTFSAHENARMCSTCKRCMGRNNVMVKACTPTSDTKCECLPGHYFNGFLICLKCQPCKRGYGFVKNCTATTNTVCERCERGKTFSVGKGFDSCKPCSKCQKGEVVKETCIRRRDTKCTPEKDFNNSKQKPFLLVPTKSKPRTNGDTRIAKEEPSKSSSGSESFSTLSTIISSTTAVTGKQKEYESLEEEETSFQAILYSLVALLVLVMIVVIIFVLRRRRSNRKRPKNRGKSVDSCEEPSTRSNSIEVVGAVENPYTSLPCIGGRQGDKLLREAPYTLITELSQHLNPGDRWKQLGGRLKFNSTQINNFALDRRTATEAMLVEWGQRDTSTVAALRDNFRAMKWSKEAKITAMYV